MKNHIYTVLGRTGCEQDAFENGS